MLTFICLFFPAVLSLRILEALAPQKLDLKHCVYTYCTNALLINFACVGAKTVILGTGAAPLCEGGWDMLPSAAFVYMIMAMACGVFIAVLELLLSRHVTFAIEEEQNAH